MMCLRCIYKGQINVTIVNSSTVLCNTWIVKILKGKIKSQSNLNTVKFVKYITNLSIKYYVVLVILSEVL